MNLHCVLSHRDTQKGGLYLASCQSPDLCDHSLGSRTAHPSHRETLRATESTEFLKRNTRMHTAYKEGAINFVHGLQLNIRSGWIPALVTKKRKGDFANRLLLSQVKQDLIRERATQAIKAVSEAFMPGWASSGERGRRGEWERGGGGGNTTRDSPLQ